MKGLRIVLNENPIESGAGVRHAEMVLLHLCQFNHLAQVRLLDDFEGIEHARACASRSDWDSHRSGSSSDRAPLECSEDPPWCQENREKKPIEVKPRSYKSSGRLAHFRLTEKNRQARSLTFFPRNQGETGSDLPAPKDQLAFLSDFVTV
jgi:hypothetical protein